MYMNANLHLIQYCVIESSSHPPSQRWGFVTSWPYEMRTRSKLSAAYPRRPIGTIDRRKKCLLLAIICYYGPLATWTHSESRNLIGHQLTKMYTKHFTTFCFIVILLLHIQFSGQDSMIHERGGNRLRMHHVKKWFDNPVRYDHLISVY